MELMSLYKLIQVLWLKKALQGVFCDSSETDPVHDLKLILHKRVSLVRKSVVAAHAARRPYAPKKSLEAEFHLRHETYLNVL